MTKAQTLVAPLAKLMNLGMAVILGLISLLLFLVTIIDLAYIAIPAFRVYLDGGQSAQSSPQGGMGQFGGQYGMTSGVPSGGYGGMQAGGLHQSQAGHSGLIGRWISDEALAVAQMDNKILSYMKKRFFFLIMFGITAVLFTSTVFTDIGIKLGMHILGILGNLKI